MPRTRAVLLLLAALGIASCDGDDPITSDLALELLEPVNGLTATVEVRNVGSVAIGPIGVEAVRVTFSGATVTGGVARVTPSAIPTLSPGSARTLEVELDSASLVGHGPYEVRLEALADGEAFGIDIPFDVAADGPVAHSLSIQAPSTAVRGEVFVVAVEALDEAGSPMPDAAVSVRLEPAGGGAVRDGRVVAYDVGTLTVVAFSGTEVVSRTVEIEPRPAAEVMFATVGAGVVTERFTSDLWVHGNHAYTGTWGIRSSGGVSTPGNALKAWDISDPAAPQLTRTVLVDARVVNDVKVSADGALAVITHELSNDGLNGITLLDLSDPAAPQVITRYTTGLAAGVHNVWIDGDFVYLVVDGIGSGLRVLDISDPSAPLQVAQYWAGESFLHDVYVRDGLAFLSHWNAGLVILDVGNGVAGGSPGDPVEVSRVRMTGETHNAWYWPEAGYVFVGEEDFQTPGIMHVVDVQDLTAPAVVATFTVDGESPPHNFWLDEERGILYAAWYENGIRAVDVNGALMGELDRQGRELGFTTYAGYEPGGCRVTMVTCTWAPQLVGDLLYASDMTHGLRVLRVQTTP